jgi:hypothetical protein
MDWFPWASLKNLPAISVIHSDIMIPSSVLDLPNGEYVEIRWKNVPVGLQTFPAPTDLLSGHWRPKKN